MRSSVKTEGFVIEMRMVHKSGHWAFNETMVWSLDPRNGFLWTHAWDVGPPEAEVLSISHRDSEDLIGDFWEERQVFISSRVFCFSVLGSKARSRKLL